MIKLAAVLALVYVAICVAVFACQRSLIYFPRPRTLGNDVAARMLEVEGARLQLTVREDDGTDAVLYFGGNAEDVSLALAEFERMFPDHAIYLMHYRGYGDSSGRPTEAALISDAIALFDDVVTRHPKIVVVGRSLGSGVAVPLASRRPVARLVLVTPFDCLATPAARAFPWLPVRLLLRDRYESYRHAPRISAPTTIVIAEHDEIIPRSSTDALVRSFGPGVASFAVIAGANHNSISEFPEYAALVCGARVDPSAESEAGDR